MLGRDGLAGLACLAGSLWLLALTRGLPQPALVPIGPGFYPRIVLSVTAILSAILVVADLVARRRAAEAGTATMGATRNVGLVATTFAIFGGYVLLLPLAGFRVATGLFVLVLQIVLDDAPGRHWIRIALVAMGTAGATHLVFEGYLSVLLPRGRWTGL